MHLGTIHVNPDIPLNGVNPGIYVQSVDGITIGTYFNSINRQTAYVGYNIQYGKFGFLTGVATGYNSSGIPFIFPSYRLAQFRIVYLPKTIDTASHVIHFSIEKEFK